MSIYDKNLEALSYRYDNFIRGLNEGKDGSSEYFVDSSRSGAKTVYFEDSGGKRVYLHSSYDPLAEAVKRSELIYKPDIDIFVVVGFGLGYFVKALFDKLQDKRKIVLIETEKGIFNKALFYNDYSEIFLSDRFLFIPYEEGSFFEDKLIDFFYDLIPYDKDTINVEYVQSYKLNCHKVKFNKSIRCINSALRKIALSRRNIYAGIDNLRMNGLVKLNFRDYNICLKSLQGLAMQRKKLFDEEVVFLATYFLFSHYSYTETFLKGDINEAE